ncbi:MAG: aldose 1-epimerase [Neisseria sp.]|nr:aldose 1-epimerase [Neisseria sp.]
MFTVETFTDRAILASGTQEAEIYFFGAILNRFERRLRSGQKHNVVVAYDDVAHAKRAITQGFHSAKLSPFACRLNQSAYTFAGENHHLAKHVLNGHAIHGLLYDAEFSLLKFGSDEQSCFVQLSYLYDFEEKGYPFVYRTIVTYRLSEQGLRIETEVKNVGKTALPLADGWHPYFALNGGVDEWTLRINGNQQLAFNQDLLPTGERIADTRFVEANSLQGIELDNSFVLNDGELACELSDGKLNLQLFAEQNYPILQVYIPPERNRIAIENLSGAPDCFNNQIGLQIVQPQETITFTARYVLQELN